MPYVLTVKPPERHLECGGCRLCCQNKTVVALFPKFGDDVASYVTHDRAIFIPGDTEPRAWLAHRSNGDCVYLGPRGCTIHDRRPCVCREFDCSHVYATTPRDERKRQIREGVGDAAIFKRGRELHQRRKAISESRPNAGPLPEAARPARLAKEGTEA